MLTLPPYQGLRSAGSRLCVISEHEIFSFLCRFPLTEQGLGETGIHFRAVGRARTISGGDIYDL